MLSCRPFRAPCFVFVTYRGLAPTAKFRRRYAASQPRMVSSMRLQPQPQSPRCYAAPQSPQRGTMDSSRGRKPTEERPKQTGSPEGAARGGLLSCRPFRALCFVFVSHRGLAPTAKFCRRYAASQPRMVSSMGRLHGHIPIAAMRIPNREWFPPWAATTVTFPSPLRGTFAFTLSCGGRCGRWCLAPRRCI